MTCVVGLVHHEGDGRPRVWMGADSCTGEPSTYHVHMEKSPKVFVLDNLAIGFTSSWRMGQLLRWRLAVPTHPYGQDGHQWMATSFIDAVRDCLKAGGFAKKTNENESGGTFLVGYQGQLYEINDDYQVSEPGEGYGAVGCGRTYALGVMHATAGREWRPDETPERRLELALGAAAYFSAYVRPPFQFVSV